MCEEDFEDGQEVHAEISTTVVRASLAKHVHACINCAFVKAMMSRDVEIKSYSLDSVSFDKADFVVHYCRAVVVVDCITGEKQDATCSFARDDEGLCGPFGDLFQAKKEAH